MRKPWDGNLLLNGAFHLPDGPVRLSGVLAEEGDHAVTTLDPSAALGLPGIVPRLLDRHVHKLERAVFVLRLPNEEITKGNVLDGKANEDTL